MLAVNQSAARGPKYYDLIVAGFCAMLLIANVAATKLIAVGPDWSPFGVHILPLVFDGGAITFPLTYVLGDCLAEVYGFAKARRAIVMGFVVSVTASLVFFLVDIAPPDASWGNQEAWTSVLGLVPRIVAGSLAGYFVGQLLNAKVLVKLRDRARPGSLWFRLIGSTVVGEAADTLLFCTIAYAFIVDWGTLGNYIGVGYVYKVGLEAVLLPITLRVIPWLKRHEWTDTTPVA
ncbi:MAG: queuosine precursor transporter [Propionibacteriaceae bacterium]|nr:queuosine precursor transporter [Propionibacteriaceae bacterium]